MKSTMTQGLLDLISRASQLESLSQNNELIRPASWFNGLPLRSGVGGK